MSIQPNLSLTTQQGFPADELQKSQFLTDIGGLAKPAGCWERFKAGMGWILSKVVWLVNIVGKTILWPVQIVSGLAFRALQLVWPQMAARTEVLWGHLMLIGQRIVAAFREEALLDDIQRLEKENQVLNTRVHDLALQVQLIRVQGDHITWEKGTIIEERDQVRRKIDERIREKEQLIAERDALRNVNQQLQARINEANAEKDVAIAAKDAALLEKNQQQNEHDQAIQKAEILRKQLDQVDNNEQLLECFQRIDTAYETQRLQKEGEEQENMTELELEQLIPIYEEQKEAYRQMIQNLLKDLSEDDPLRIPMEGFIRIFTEEAGHLRRISREIHVYAELRESLKPIQQTNM
jgi:hypothetical protein